MILAGDVGGTNTRLASFTVRDGQLSLEHLEKYENRHYPGLAAIVGEFVGQLDGAPERACLGVAGPVRGPRVEATNLPWVIDAGELGEDHGIADVTLVNDLAANAWGIEMLGDEDVHELHSGATEASGNRAVISAGTGLGQAGMYHDGARYHPFATEGGHTEFAPQTEQQIELLRFLLRRMQHVSWERVVSGQGLQNIYEFVRGGSHTASFDEFPAEHVVEHDIPATIAATALAEAAPTCVEALKLFVALYGAEAGNLALKLMATGGVYVGGGIAPKILPRLVDGSFMEWFQAKGRNSHLMVTMPVRVILNPDTALLGAGLVAALRGRLLERA